MIPLIISLRTEACLMRRPGGPGQQTGGDGQRLRRPGDRRLPACKWHRGRLIQPDPLRHGLRGDMDAAMTQWPTSAMTKGQQQRNSCCAARCHVQRWCFEL